MKVNIAAVVAVLLGFVTIGLLVWEPEKYQVPAVAIAVLSLTAALLSFRE